MLCTCQLEVNDKIYVRQVDEAHHCLWKNSDRCSSIATGIGFPFEQRLLRLHWAVKDMIKMFSELCMAQLFVRVAMKAGPVSCVAQASF